MSKEVISKTRPEHPPPEALSIGLRSHPHCVVCGQSNSQGLRLRFITSEDGSVESRFHCSTAFEGYPNQLHGGVIALLLDGAMTNCLFASGYVGVTAALEVRYRHPVAADGSAVLRAWLDRSRPPLHILTAELEQDGRIKATATAKFMENRRETSARQGGELE